MSKAENIANQQIAEVILILAVILGVVSLVSHLFFDEDAPFQGWFGRWRDKRRRVKLQRRNERQRAKREAETKKRLAEIEANRPTREQLVERLNESYQSDIEIIDKTLLDDMEKEAAKENRKQRYLRRLSELV